eukprot:gene25312-31755_t
MFNSRTKTALLNTLTEKMPVMLVATVPDILYSLGIFDLRWTALPKQLQKNILVSLCSGFQSGNILTRSKASTFLSLSNMGFSIEDSVNPEVDRFAAAVVNAVSKGKWIDELDKSYILSNLMQSLAKMGFAFSDGSRNSDSVSKHNPMIARLMRRITEYQTNFTSNELNTVLISLAEMKLLWRDLPGELRARLLRNLTEIKQTGSSSITLHSLQKLRAKWSDLPRGVQDVLLTYTLANKSESRVIAKAFYALGRLNFDITSTSPANREEIHQLAASVLTDTRLRDYQALSDLMLGLTCMGCKYATSPEYLRSAVERSLENNLSSLGDIAVANIIHSLGKMEFVWSNLSPRAVQAIDFSLNKHMPRFTEAHTVGSIMGLSKMGADMEDLSAALQFTVYNALATRMMNMYPQEMSNAINTLSRLNVQWVNFHPQLIASATSALYEKMPFMDCMEVSNTVYGLGRMEFKLNTVQQELRDTIEEAVQRVLSDEEAPPRFEQDGEEEKSYIAKQEQYKTHHVSNIVYSLGKCNAKWSDLSPGVKDALEASIPTCNPPINNQSLSMTLHGFVRMSTLWEDLSSPLRNHIMDVLGDPATFSERHALHTAQTLVALGKMGVEWDRLPSNNRVNLQQALVNSAHNFTAKNITHALNGLTYLNAQWVSLSEVTRLAITDTIDRTHSSMDVQKASFCGNALSMMTFDEPFDANVLSSHRNILKRLKLHEHQLEDEYNLALYLETLSARPETLALLHEIFGTPPDIKIPERANTQTSRDWLWDLLRVELGRLSDKYFLVKNCSALNSGAFHMQCAVYHESTFVAFIDKVTFQVWKVSVVEENEGSDLKLTKRARDKQFATEMAVTIHSERFKAKEGSSVE